ncbi:MAG: hypothetical protein U1F27_02270 [Turneriella sp.]
MLAIKARFKRWPATALKLVDEINTIETRYPRRVSSNCTVHYLNPTPRKAKSYWQERRKAGAFKWIFWFSCYD